LSRARSDAPRVDQGGSTVSFAQLVKRAWRPWGQPEDLARAAKVTTPTSRSCSRSEGPSAPERTDVYEEMERFLEIPRGELARLVRPSARAGEEASRYGADALFREFRDLVLRKCVPARREQVRAVFEREPFGTLERLVAQKLLEVVQGVAREELDSESWLRLAARVGERSHEEMRVLVLEFLDTTSSGCRAKVPRLPRPAARVLDIDLESFRLDIRLHRRLVAEPRRTFAFAESDRVAPAPRGRVSRSSSRMPA